MPALTRRQAVALRERDDLNVQLEAQENQIARLKREIGILHTEIDRLHGMIDQARAAGWQIETPNVRPEVLMEAIKEKASAMRRELGSRARAPKGAKPDQTPYDVAWQVEGEHEPERPDTGTEHPL